MANSHVQGLSLRTRVHVMTIGRTKWGINKGRAPAHRTANQLHRCVAASLSDDGGQSISNFVAGSARRPCATEVQ